MLKFFNKYRYIGLLAMLLLHSCSKEIIISPEQSESFVKFYGSVFENEGRSILSLTDGGYAIVGTSQKKNGNLSSDKDIIFLKLDKNGNQIGDSKFFGGLNDDEGYCIKQTTDGGYIICGKYSLSNSSDLFLIRIDANGDSLWSKTFGGSNNDAGNKVIQTLDGGFVIVGYSEAIAGNKDMWILKVDSNGDYIWEKQFGFAGNDELYNIEEKENGFVISGYASNNVKFPGIKSGFIATTGLTGNISNVVYFSSQNAILDGYFFTLPNQSGYVYTATMELSGSGVKKIQMAKLDSDLNIDSSLTKIIDIAGSNGVNSVKVLNDGFVLTGIDYAANDILIAEIDFGGNVIFSTTYGDAGFQNAFDISICKDGGYIITGQNRFIENENSLISIIKTRADGKQ